MSGYWKLATGNSLLATPLTRLHVFEGERLTVQRGRLADAMEFPGRGIGEVLVVSQRFAVGRLAFFAEVPAAALRTMKRVEGQHFSKLQIICDSSRVFEVL